MISWSYHCRQREFLKGGGGEGVGLRHWLKHRTWISEISSRPLKLPSNKQICVTVSKTQVSIIRSWLETTHITYDDSLYDYLVHTLLLLTASDSITQNILESIYYVRYGAIETRNHILSLISDRLVQMRWLWWKLIYNPVQDPFRSLHDCYHRFWPAFYQSAVSSS